ncbi:hypothetical protein [Nesterenkonia pannonica]|uniref:zinc-dependent metalloprotease n=1 Tax=Nesterenkonia pannonica TaxID=1548602 RepID=UPI002164539A|nr:hypothetical protein [Nesterenkonia pannonica]
MTRLEEIAQGIDPQDPETLEIDLGVDLFAEHTDMQKAALRRIETTVALVEGGSTMWSARRVPTCRRPSASGR